MKTCTLFKASFRHAVSVTVSETTVNLGEPGKRIPRKILSWWNFPLLWYPLHPHPAAPLTRSPCCSFPSLVSEWVTHPHPPPPVPLLGHSPPLPIPHNYCLHDYPPPPLLPPACCHLLRSFIVYYTPGWKSLLIQVPRSGLCLCLEFCSML